MKNHEPPPQRILLTGANGFIGKELTNFFSDSRHHVLATCRETLDVTNELQVDNFFKDNEILIEIALPGLNKKNIELIYSDGFLNIKNVTDKNDRCT